MVAITSLLLSSVFIFALRGRRRPSVFMASCRLFTSVFLIINFFQTYHTPYYGQVLWNPIHLFTALVSYPLLFAYMFSLMRPQTISLRYWLGCYMPLAALIVLYAVFNVLRGELPVIMDYAQLDELFGEPGLWVRFAGTALFAVEVTAFTILTFRMQRQHERNLSSDFSYTEGSTLGWIRWNAAINFVKGVFTVLIMVVEGPEIKLVTSIIFIIEPILTTIWVLQQKDLYLQPSSGELLSAEELLLASNEASSCQYQQNRQRLKVNLLNLLEQEEIFKDADLSSEKVREMLLTNRTYLSQVINHDLGTNFYTLINTYRLRKAVGIMEDPVYRRMPLKSVADICGFKSLSAFSTIFRQTYGTTPSEWKEKRKSELV